MKKIFLILLIFSGLATISARPDYKTISPFFKKYINKNGVVDYVLLKKRSAELEKTLSYLTKIPPLDTWHRNEKLAYWLNVYNLQMLKIIVEHYPFENMLDLYDGKIWQVKCVKIGEKTYCLDEIEQDIIRRELKEPRIHFAFFTGAVSSPVLLNQVFTPANMNQHFETLTKRYIGTNNNQISESKIVISPIFKWYESDFKDIIAFINQYSSVKIRKDAEVVFADYNWNLKEK